MQNALEAHMTSSLCLSVLVGCPASPTQLPEGPCLIIDAESIDKKELIAQESFCTNYPELSASDVVLVDQTVISEYDHQIVEWYNFSDKRFNGPSQLLEFSDQYPNLRLIESRKIEGITLSTVLVDQNVLSDPLSTFELILREGDPLVALQSAKEWLARCTRISLRGLVTSSKSREAAEAFLGASGFCKSSVDSCVWTPELEMSSLHLSLIRCGLLALFNADIYRKLYPQTKEMADVELIDHWLSQPDFRDISKIMNDAIQRIPTPLAELTEQDPALQLLQNIFPFDLYRSQRTDLSQFPNRQLINHYWSNGQYEGIDLSESKVINILEKDHSLQVSRLTTRIHELEHLLSCANAQISAMQKLIVSSRNSGAPNEQN